MTEVDMMYIDSEDNFDISSEKDSDYGLEVENIPPPSKPKKTYKKALTKKSSKKKNILTIKAKENILDESEYDEDYVFHKERKISKNKTVEQIYQKKTQLEHILLRPDTYIGSVESVTQQMYVLNDDTKRIIQREITFTPGLFKIFDEIVVNAADNKQRDPNMDKLEIEINPRLNKISVKNNGKGIPVVIHKEHNCYVPTLIFGQLLTGSNFNDDEKKTTGGRNGYGAKLANIFSNKFIVESIDCKTL